MDPWMGESTRRTGIGLVVAAFAASACGSGETAPKEAPVYVGGAECVRCHEAEAGLWRGSHHDLAMQEATGETVLGDFSGATFSLRGVTSTFSRRGEEYHVRTEGPEGEVGDYEIRYTFGVSPLQQYLIPTTDGRYQVLGIAWDARRAEDGGQRWIHLYPDEDTGPGSPLHWTRPTQNWNTGCAECHSTDLRKGYDPETRSYSTTWSDIDVSCEACHGPGSAHVERAKAVESGGGGASADWGLAAIHRGEGEWVFAPGARTASLSQPRTSTEVEACAPCHSRRSGIWPETGATLHDRYRVSLLSEGLYHPDGQILDEVYVYGSFLQSKMYRAGVICSDCHQPHSLELGGDGNDVCARCHDPVAFDTPDHHFHPSGSSGSQCVQCHMPETTYMVVDPRRDHGIRVPRPDLGEAIDAPDACGACHQERPRSWVREAFEGWYGPTDLADHPGVAIARGRRGAPGAGTSLARLASDPEAAAIVRGTALSLLGRYPSEEAVGVVQAGLADPDPLVRGGAAAAVGAFPAEIGPALALTMLGDPVRSVRLEAVRAVLGTPSDAVPPDLRDAFEAALDEYVEALRLNQDRPAGWTALGDFHAARGRADEALLAYREAMATDETDVVAYLNLADLQRALGQEDLAEDVLQLGLEARPESPELTHAMGLLRVRQGRLEEAIPLLELAAAARPENARFQYVRGVALASGGEPGAGIEALRSASEDHPFDRDILAALATYLRDAGDIAGAIVYAERLVAVIPGDEGAVALLQQLRGGGP